MDISLENEVNLHKKEILSSIMSASYKAKAQKDYFMEVNQDILNIVRKDPNINLKQLQKDILKKYFSSNIHIELFLIDKKYTTFKTTYEKDLGFDLSVVVEAKRLLDKTSQDGKIYINDFASIDALDLKHKLYSYTKVKDGLFLEVGFIDKSIVNTINQLLEATKQTQTKITLYLASKDDKQYYYYEMKKRGNVENKNDYFKSLNKFLLNEKTNDLIINTIQQDSHIKTIDGNIHTVYTKVFNKNMHEKIGFVDIVLKMEVDVSEKIAFMKQYKKIFLIFLLIVFVLIILLFLFIRKRFTSPVDKILNSLVAHEKMSDKATLELNNELSDIASNYNALFDSLALQIEKNVFLLAEKRQFISDTVHQIRTPLANIMMNTDMIKLYERDKKLSSYIDQINSSISILNSSYEDLAYIATYDTMEYEPISLCLSRILHERVSFFETISKISKKEINFQIVPDLYFIINQIELERLIDNNISNAIQHSKPNKPIAIQLIEKDKRAQLEFKTFGDPIQDTLKIFEKNYRENSRKKGLGLGLFMVKNICNKYDIEYFVTSWKNQNTFTYIFPNR